MASDDSRIVPLTASHHELRSRRPPPQLLVLPESTLTGYTTSHLHGQHYPVPQANLGSPTTQLVHPEYGGQLPGPTQDTCSPRIPRLPSLTTEDTPTSTATPLPPFRELVQPLDSSPQWVYWRGNDDQNPLRDIGSQSSINPRPLDQRPVNSSSTSLQSVFYPENGYWSMPYGAGPQFWTGSQPLGQRSLYDRSNREITSTQNLGAITPDYSIPIMAQSRNGARGSHHRLPTSEGPQVDSREILVHNQDTSDSRLISPGVNRKRKWVPHSSDSTNGPSKRRTGAADGVTLDIQKEALTNGVRNSDNSLPYQSSVSLLLGRTRPAELTRSEGSSSSRTTPTATEVARPEPIEYNQDTRPENGGEFFREARNVVMRDPKMTAVGVQHVYVQGDHFNDAALQWLKGHAMRGAEHNSADRDPPPRCHPGTRTTITQTIQDWLGSSERQKNLLWLRGTAGVGKSAIVQTAAETLSETGRLGASLFFSRPNGRSNPRQIFPTLAYRFAVQDPLYREYIVQLMRTDPESLDKAMSEQFRILIVEPFAHKRIRSGKAAWAVTLDGLDECGEDPNGRRHSNDVQRDVVRLISGSVQQYPRVPLIWIIASRPEVHLKAVFSERDVFPSLWEENVPVDSDEACKDVEKFLHKEFTEISQKYPEYILDSPWPTHKQFLKIAHAALGLFIFAEVVVRFIGDPEVGNPIGQLECLLLAISEMHSKNQQNPLANLDAIYLAILSKIPPSTLQITKRLLGFLILLNKKNVNVSDCKLHDLCKILDISKYTGITTLRHLHSVLYIRKVKDLGVTRPRLYHASFRDFLEDKSRSHEYFVDKQLFTKDLFLQDLVRVAQAQFSSDPDSPLSPFSGENKPGCYTSGFVRHVFQGDFSLNGVHLPEGNLSWLSPLADAQLQPFLESLNVLRFMEYAGYGFFWEFKEGNERELSRRGFLSCTTLGSLGIDWATVSVSISKLGGYFQHVQVDTTLERRYLQAFKLSPMEIVQRYKNFAVAPRLLRPTEK